jgi:hypothetical protein
VAACPNCGSENAEGANFCSICDAQLGAAEAPKAAEVRKIVTIVFGSARSTQRARRLTATEGSCSTPGS